MAGARGRLLIIDDSPETSELLSVVVEEEGFTPIVCNSGQAGLDAYESERPVAVLLDWVMPDRPGIDVCRQLRERDPAVPIIFVSGRDDEASASRGLDAGADDFVVKPVRRIELVARLEAHLRKVHDLTQGRVPKAGAPAGGDHDEGNRFGLVDIDSAARIVRVDGEEVALGPLEFKLLEYFGRNAGIAISREQVLNEVYGYDADISTERVDLLVRRLRTKLGEGPDRGGQLVAVPGYGYRLERRRPPDE
ncbi:MAG TPA: response regulator transcription factor [Candidatus Dormibacteraeota bacterium]